MKKLLIAAILSVSLIGCGTELKINQGEMGATLYQNINMTKYM